MGQRLLLICAILALALNAPFSAEAKRPLVAKGRAFALLTEDPSIARQSGLTRAALQCLARSRGDLPSVFNDMFDPHLGRGIYGDVQPHLAVISYTDHLLRFPPGKMIAEMRTLERDKSGLRATLEDPRLKKAYGIIGDVGNLLQPSALGLLDMLGKKTMGALHKRLQSRSIDLVYRAYLDAYQRTGNDRRAWDLVDSWQYNTASASARDLRYAWRTASAQLARVSQGLGMGISGDVLLRRIVLDAQRNRASYINVDVVLDGIVRSQMWQAKIDAAKAIAAHPDVYRCVRDPNHRPDPFVDPDRPAPNDLALKNCLCGCLAENTNFSCGWNTQDKGTSPSCRKLENGPCICKAFGCFRKQPPQSGACHRECMAKFGR